MGAKTWIMVSHSRVVEFLGNSYFLPFVGRNEGSGGRRLSHFPHPHLPIHPSTLLQPHSCRVLILFDSPVFHLLICLPEILFPTNYHNTLVPTPASLSFTSPISFVKSSSSLHPYHHFSLDFVPRLFLFSIYNNYCLSVTISQTSLLLLQPDIPIWISHELIRLSTAKTNFIISPPKSTASPPASPGSGHCTHHCPPSCSSHQLEYHPSLVLTPTSSHPVLSILPPERK